jgi:hypothetical protein
VNGPPKSGSIPENFSKERTWNFKIALVSSTMIIVEKFFFIYFLALREDKKPTTSSDEARSRSS